ncbi:MAG: phosphomannomutase/phosphoglucomutase [Mogibacterium sp.]|nr:phosphomannomutase/phosphoglucomutase [Mogibacterium sp.]
MIDFKKLQNGSDIRGVAVATEGGPEVNLSKEVAGQITGAFIYWLSKKVQKNPVMLKVCIGHDPRVSADELKEGALEAISLWGAEGYDAGLTTTPAMFMATVMPQFEFDGAIMITASHLPYERNGFKFFTAEGGTEKEDIAEILRLASRYTFIGGVYDEMKTNVTMIYASYLRQMISMGLRDVPGYLKGMHIVVDAGNGAAGFFAKEVLEKMGADVSGSLYLEPDGTFPNHPANPENKEAMAAICKAVRDNDADLGIIFDTDGDRSAAVAPGGRPIARNEIVALAAALAADDYPGGTVVTDSITSNELHEFLEGKLGLKHYRYKRGYRNVINKAKELRAAGEDAFLAIETSGHAAYSDNYYLDDGAFLAVQIVINAARLKAEGKDINALIDGLRTPAESREVRLKIKAEDFAKYGSGVLEDFGKWAEYSRDLEVVEPNYEGVRVNYDLDGYKGWFLLRMSLHDPVMPLNVESDTEGGADRALAAIYDFMKDYKEIEIPES